jgi:CheY-like chemotaxis protein
MFGRFAPKTHDALFFLGGMKLDEAVVISGPGESHKPVILLVEDDVLVRFTTADILREAGFDVLEAVDSSEALALLTTGHPLDLVITDIRMPGRMDGVQLASVIKATRPNLPIALLSSHLDCPDHDADVFVAKPYDVGELVGVVKRLIGAEWRSNLASPNAS